MKHRSVSSALAGCAAALCLCVLLAGCGAAGESPAPSSQSLSEAPASQALPSGQGDAIPAPSSAASFDDSENGLLRDPSDAFAAGLGWGPGTAGTSLKSVAAAASMLDWAGENHIAKRSDSSVADCLAGWYNALSGFEQESFAEAWPLIQDAADSLVEDPDSMAGLLEDAGVDKAPACSAEDWQALSAALDRLVPAPQQ